MYLTVFVIYYLPTYFFSVFCLVHLLIILTYGVKSKKGNETYI